MELTVLHYHFRPGGVRQVIEAGLPALVRAAGVRRVILAGGEGPDGTWRERLEAALHPCAVEWRISPVLGYWSEQVQGVAEVLAEIRDCVRGLTIPGGVLWAHNLSVGRNMLLAQAVAELPRDRDVWLHHHDWWWDGRWERWPEMAEQGIDGLAAALEITLPRHPRCRHFCINAGDVRLLREWTGMDACFLPNPVSPAGVDHGEADRAREFLGRRTGAARHWLYPCRGLRRKNIAEALLVQRCMDPEAVTVTTGGASSAAEVPYCAALDAAARRHGWPLFMGVCADGSAPDVPSLLAVASVAAVTSLREGFGLPYHEAAAAGRPLMARIPGGLQETLDATGLVFNSGWSELLIPPDLVDWTAELSRRETGLRTLASMLPRELREDRAPAAPEQGKPVDFGSLTLEGQLHVLIQPDTVLHSACLALNPVLRRPAEPQRPGRDWPPSVWAEALIQGARHPVIFQPDSPFAAHARRFLDPLLVRWLRHPLLWPAG